MRYIIQSSRSGIFLGCVLLAAGLAHADAGYQETFQITGGQLVDSLRSVPFMPKSFKQMLEPVNSRILVHGNQLVSMTRSSTQIIDLDHETITRIDNDKRTYSVTSFVQMRQAMKDASGKIQEAQGKMRQAQPATPTNAAAAPQLQVTFDVAVSDPGVSKVINGVMAKEQLMTMKAHVTDLNPPPNSPVQTVAYTVVSDLWTAPEPPEMQEIDDFYRRYAQKLMQGVDVSALTKDMQPVMDGSMMAPLFAQHPGMGPAVQEMSKKMATEMEKIRGVRILEITRMGGETMAAPSGTPSSAAAAGGAPNAGGAIAGQVTADTATSVAAQQTSKLGALGSAFGNSILGAFHRNTSAAAPTAQAATAGTEGGAATSSAVLYETTTQKSDFSRETVSSAVFQVPAGFTLVNSP